MDEASKVRYESLKKRAEGLRRDARERPHLAGSLRELADRLDAEAAELLRSHSDEENEGPSED